eukprot:403354592
MKSQTMNDNAYKNTALISSTFNDKYIDTIDSDNLIININSENKRDISVKNKQQRLLQTTNQTAVAQEALNKAFKDAGSSLSKAELYNKIAPTVIVPYIQAGKSSLVAASSSAIAKEAVLTGLKSWLTILNDGYKTAYNSPLFEYMDITNSTIVEQLFTSGDFSTYSTFKLYESGGKWVDTTTETSSQSGSSRTSSSNTSATPLEYAVVIGIPAVICIAFIITWFIVLKYCIVMEKSPDNGEQRLVLKCCCGKKGRGSTLGGADRFSNQSVVDTTMQNIVP